MRRLGFKGLGVQGFRFRVQGLRLQSVERGRDPYPSVKDHDAVVCFKWDTHSCVPPGNM